MFTNFSTLLNLKVMMTAAMMGAAVLSMTAGVTGAVFTSSSSVGSNNFTTGSVDISALPASSVFSVGAMAPGDVVTASIDVTNSGTLQQRYSVTSTSTEDTLAAQLDLAVKTGVSSCDNSGFGVDGTFLYGPADSGSTTTTNVVGDPTQGGDAGDRTLAATASEVLCFQISLPASTSAAFQGTSTALTFDFQAEQTANN
ncbi:TasA family protein [Candidatus Lucifugimonas marina]|uniref:Camelysin metallo-endopeptidase n=1 Tax=Candidatus Lucifugimonas marina TaxID=3038979 RepID=A0AAJ5ZE52_9CHLR|nr:hypothetical protein [SAR202 cluster bacterium JH702]MDG0870904.1 hypothetical protein [SAR202 cluster bacterium JH639]WFG35862.1 hypothetical protein GKN94_09195 [SAR202 cluster bacterium JH545]WFG39807.1 hypothetical protein GKO48_09305 [SAR202 cluster bacterium JH1073]